MDRSRITEYYLPYDIYYFEVVTCHCYKVDSLNAQDEILISWKSLLHPGSGLEMWSGFLGLMIIYKQIFLVRQVRFGCRGWTLDLAERLPEPSKGGI